VTTVVGVEDFEDMRTMLVVGEKGICQNFPKKIAR
jgi:hypothetical protein